MLPVTGHTLDLERLPTSRTAVARLEWEPERAVDCRLDNHTVVTGQARLRSGSRIEHVDANLLGWPPRFGRIPVGIFRARDERKSTHVLGNSTAHISPRRTVKSSESSKP